MTQEVVSFVLRFVREGGNGRPVRWRGVIKHVQGDNIADFAHFSDALHFMQDHVNEVIRQTFSGEAPITPEGVLAETTRLWGEMAPRYTDIMLQSMEVMLEQGRRVGESMAESMANWGQPDQYEQQRQMLVLLERMAAQIEALVDRVEALEERLNGE